MPTLHIRGVPSDLMARLRASARAADEPLDQHAIDVLAHGLTIRQARRAGADATNTAMTPAERTARARRAAQARWTPRAPTGGLDD